VAKVKQSDTMPIEIEISTPSDCDHIRVAEIKQSNTALSSALSSVTLTLLPREAQVLHSILAGKQNAQIAEELGIDEAVVREHIKLILRRVRTIKNGNPAGPDKDKD
jgi:DNA-binding NarL/FixJ family response regulator